MERDSWVRDPLARALIIVLLIIASLQLGAVLWSLAGQFADIILIFFLSWMLAFILAPLVSFMTASGHVPRAVSVVVIYLTLVAVLVIGGILVVPLAVSQAIQLGNALPGYVAQAPGWGTAIQFWFDERSIPVDVQQFLSGQAIARQAESIGTTVAQNAIAILGATVVTVVNLVLVLILSLYMLLDSGNLVKRLLARLPFDRQVEAAYFLRCIDHTFGGFIRGVMVIGVVYGVGTAIVMQVAQLPYVLAVSLFSGFMMIVPFIGGLLGIIPPLVIAAFSGSLATLIVVGVALLLLQQLLLNVIAPKVMSEAVGIHPLLVFLAILLGAKVAGAWGAIFGVPVAGVLYAMTEFFFGRAAYLQSLRADESAPHPERESVEVS